MMTKTGRSESLAVGLQEIGEGGMGVVYMAEQSQPVKRRVALKIIKPGMDSRHIIARFEAEQQALAMMEHPNVARVLDAGTTDAGRPYFAMELVKGIPITKYCDENHLTNRQRLELFADVCHAVQHAHHKGIIHRDLKPSARWPWTCSGISATNRSRPVHHRPAIECANSLQFTLDKTGEAPNGMVRVAGNAHKPNIFRKSFDHIELDDYYIDRFEVTNRQFKEFVDAGGYGNREYWDSEFERGTDLLAWDDVKHEFIDQSNLPGPATWRDGAYPEGEADYPVRGVSWYEAPAYARFAEKELPTVVHWLRARGGGWGSLMQIAGQSHIGSENAGPVAVGSRNGIGPFGTHDMAGNVAEWCFNSGDKPMRTGDRPQRSLMGASWNDVAYKFAQVDFRAPLNRSETVGFRCAKYSVSLVPPEVLALISRTAERDLLSETPINDEMYELCKGIFTRHLSGKRPLMPKVTQCKVTEKYRHEKVVINAGYDDQRLAIPRCGMNCCSWLIAVGRSFFRSIKEASIAVVQAN